MHSQIETHLLMHDALVDATQLDRAVGSLAKRSLVIDDSPPSSLTTANIRATIRSTIRSTGQLGLIVLDYLQLLGNGDSNRVRELDKISYDLKSIAKEFDVPFVALSQLSRAVETRSDKRPIPSDLRDSGAIEQAADLVIMLYRDEYYNPNSPDKGTIEAIVGKNRNGPVGMAKLKFDPAIGQFKSHER